MNRRRYMLGVGAGVLVPLSVTAQEVDGPTVETLEKDPGPDETVGTEASIDVSMEASVSDGALQEAVWIEGRNHTEIGRTPLEGATDGATVTFEETPHWIAYGYPTHVRVVSADGRQSGLETADGPEVRQPFAVEILETNDPVGAGDPLEVSAAVEHVGDMQMIGPNEQQVALVVGGETVDAETVFLEWNESETLTLGYETYPVRRDVEFPVRVVCEDDVDETTVEVLADGVPGDVAVSIENTNAPVTAGEELWVGTVVRNGGASTATEGLELVVGGETVDSASVTVDPGDEEWVTLSYVTYEVRQDVEFPVRVVGVRDADEVTVEVFADEPGDRAGELGVSITTTNAPVTGGEFLDAQVSVGNDGTEHAEGVVQLVVGGDVVDSRTVSVPGEATQTIGLGYETYPVRRDTQVTLTVRSEADEDSTTVTVYGTEEASADEGEGDDTEADEPAAETAEAEDDEAAVDDPDDASDETEPPNGEEEPANGNGEPTNGNGVE